MKINHTFTTIILCIALLFAPLTRAKADAKSLLGSVLPDYPLDLPGWSVEISAEMQGGGILAGSPQTSSGDIYFFQADQDTVVSFVFARTYYRYKRSPWINVTTDLSNPYRVMPNITLHRIRSSRGTASLVRPPTDSVFKTVSYERPVTEVPAQSREELRKELEEQAELARVSKTADVFQFNLEVYGDAYRETEDLKNEVVKFKGEEKFKDVTVAPPGRAEVYKKMVQRDRGEKVEIDSDTLFNIANDASISPTVRIQSVRSMTTIGSIKDKKTLDFLREKSLDSSSKLYLQSLIQLMKIGTPADKTEILKGLKGSDVQRAISVVTALEGARSTEGDDALKELSDRTDLEPVVKEYAKQSASRFTSTSTDARGSSIKSPDRFQELFRDGVESLFRRPARASTQTIVFTGAAKDAVGQVKLTPGAAGTTQVRVDFRSLGNIEGGGNYVLWAVAPDNRVVRLGQVFAALGRRSARIETRTSLEHFGLFITVEKSGTVLEPTGPVVAVIKTP